ncbi:MAG: cyclic nucleotide-binding domain-containing protein [Rhodobacteraceae bacterium]|nr:cyclic nucleotide-binding domain-containing protein [Paracoccaceae bacterium]
MDEITLIFEAMAGPLPDWHALERHITWLNVAAGGEVFALGQAAPHVYVVTKGLLKLHHDDENGRERIKSFAVEGGIVASISALQPHGSASFSASALEDTRLAKIPYTALEKMADTHLAWGRLLRAVLMGYAAQKEQREQGFLMQSAAQRYAVQMQSQPELAARIIQKDFAAYLGVTPVGLSRIASRIAKISDD